MLLLLLAILLSVGELTAASYCVQDCSSTGLKLRTVNTRNATITLDAGGNSAPSIIFKLEGTEAARLDSSGLNLKTDLNMNLNQITAAAIRNDGFIYSESAAGAIRFAPGTGNATLQFHNTVIYRAIMQDPNPTYVQFINTPQFEGYEDFVVTIVNPQLLRSKAVGLFFSSDPLTTFYELAFTPSLKFNGSDDGMVYEEQTGIYQRLNSRIHVLIHLRLEDPGTSCGPATIEGLPFKARNQTGLKQSLSVTVAYLQSFFLTVAFAIPGESYLKLSISTFTSGFSDLEQNCGSPVFQNGTELIIEGDYYADAFVLPGFF